MGEWAVVTGASRGIGKALVEKLAVETPGLRVLAVGRSVGQAGFHQGNVEWVEADLACEEGRQALISRLQSCRIRYLIHNAGLFGPQTLSATSLQSFQEVMRINVEAPLLLSKGLKDNLVPGARILLMGSKAGLEYMLNAVGYCVSKAGVFMLKQVLNEEFRTHQIHTGIVMYALPRPGITNTSMFHQWYSTLQDKSSIDLSLVLSPELVAVYLVFLLKVVSDAEFRSEIWDVYDESRYGLWVPKGWAPPRLPFVQKL